MSEIQEKPTIAFAKAIKFLRFCAALVGCDVFKLDYRFNCVTMLVSMAIVTYFIFAILTIVKLFHEDWKIVLEAFCLSCSVIQGATKLIITVANVKEIQSIQAYLDKIYKDYEERGPNYFKALHESCDRARKTYKLLGVMIVIPAFLMVLTPFFLLLVTNERYLVIQFHFPGIDPSTTIGYFITYCAHSGFMFAGCFGLYAGDLVIILYMIQSILFVDILKCKIEDLNVLTDTDGMQSTQKISYLIYDIIEWHQDYMSYTKRIDAVFHYVVSVIILTSGISIILCVFIVLHGDWPGAYPYLLVTFYTLYVYCILGTKIEISNDRVIREIYNIHWYNLTPSQQRVVKLMLMQSQRPVTVTVAGVLPLSVTTALQITKTVYSIFMAMLQFLDN